MRPAEASRSKAGTAPWCTAGHGPKADSALPSVDECGGDLDDGNRPRVRQDPREGNPPGGSYRSLRSTFLVVFNKLSTATLCVSDRSSM